MESTLSQKACPDFGLDQMQKPPLRVLIIEDTADRQKILSSLYRSHAWILVNSSHRAIKLVSAYEFDIISLDYNIRGDQSGADVALALKDSRNKNARIIVHSLNPKGVKEILEILPDAIPIPVSKMTRSNKAFKHLRNKIDELGASYDWRHYARAKNSSTPAGGVR